MKKVELKNYTETVARQILKELVNKKQLDVCTCEQCLLDVLAMALNNLPPHYYVSNQGEVYSKLLATYNEFKTRVITELTKAAIKVKNNPRH